MAGPRRAGELYAGALRRFRLGSVGMNGHQDSTAERIVADALDAIIYAD